MREFFAKTARLRVWIVGVSDENFRLIRLAVVLAEFVELQFLLGLFILGIVQVSHDCLILFTKVFDSVSAPLRSRLLLSDLALFFVFLFLQTLFFAKNFMADLFVLDEVYWIDKRITGASLFFFLLFSSSLSFFQSDTSGLK